MASYDSKIIYKSVLKYATIWSSNAPQTHSDGTFSQTTVHC